MSSEDTFDWRSLSSEELEPHFNPRLAVPDALDWITRYSERSAEARESLAGDYGLRFGEGEKCTYDYHPAAGADGGGGGPRPLVIFIHGGYWRLLDKDDHSFAVPALVAAGCDVINLNYDLCPTVTLDTIVDEVKQAFVHIWGEAEARGFDRGAVHLMGHSAGAHLAASLLLYDWAALGLPADPIASVIACSGIYEPEAARRISLNEDIQLTPETAARQDMLAHPPRSKARMLVQVGGAEPPGWTAQSSAYAELCRKAGLATEFQLVPDCHHFQVLEAACDPDNAAFAAALRTING